jgi:hypothetical protein
LAAERDAQAAGTPQVRLLTQTEAAILRPVGGDETKLPAAAQTRLEDVRQQIDAAQHPQADTPAMAKVRDELGATQQAMAAAEPKPAAPPVESTPAPPTEHPGLIVTSLESGKTTHIQPPGTVPIRPYAPWI